MDLARPIAASIAAALGVALALGIALQAPSVGSWWRGETDLAGRRIYRPDHEVPLQALQGVDFERVHGELWPAWAISVAAGEGDRAHTALREAVAADPNLVDLVDDVHALAADPVRRADGLLHRAWAWNRYLDDRGIGWRMALAVQLGGDGALVYVKTYGVVSDTRTAVGDERYRTRILRRADGTNVVEAWLGTTHDHEDGALVVLDRLAVFTLDRVWPLLDPELDVEREPLARAFAPAIREGVARSLPAEQVAILGETARERYWMGRAVDAVHGRHACGSRFVIGEIPFDGMGPDDLRTLRRFAAATGSAPCPDVTAHEALVFSQGTSRLRSVEGLRPALEALVAWSARGVVAHEARHAADQRLSGPEGVPACQGCPPDLPPVGLQELSAYLASFADPGHGALALYQACGLDPAQVPMRAEIVRWLADRLGASCDGSPPPDLAERARALEAELFGRDEPVRLDPMFPLSLALPGEPAASEPPPGDPAAADQ